MVGTPRELKAFTDRNRENLGPVNLTPITSSCGSAADSILGQIRCAHRRPAERAYGMGENVMSILVSPLVEDKGGTGSRNPRADTGCPSHRYPSEKGAISTLAQSDQCHDFDGEGVERARVLVYSVCNIQNSPACKWEILNTDGRLSYTPSLERRHKLALGNAFQCVEAWRYWN